MAHIGRFFRDVGLPVAGAVAGGLIGGPAGAVAGASLAQGVGGSIKNTSDAKKVTTSLLSAQQEGNAAAERYRKTLDTQLAGNESKVNSAIARSSRARRSGGVFDGEVQLGGKGPTATLG